MPRIAASDSRELIASEALAKYMNQRGETVRSLAEKTRVHRCTIGRLRAGAQNMCTAEQAQLIEQELQVPFGRLFVAPEVSRVSRDSMGDETGVSAA